MQKRRISKKADHRNIRYDILDHGYLVLVDVMGNDHEIAEAARVSYIKKAKNPSPDSGLLDFMMRHYHTSPFEQAELKFEVHLPIFVERQWVRHRTAHMNELSGRYSEMPEEVYVPHANVVGEQSKNNKQVRLLDGGHHPYGEQFRQHVRENAAKCFADYRVALEKGIPRELARIQLPLGTYTTKVWKMDLHNLFNFLLRRDDSHAQWEIQQYAGIMAQIVEDHFPLAYAQWLNHIKDAVKFSADEWDLIYALIDMENLLPSLEESGLSKSRIRELRVKLGAD